MHTHEHINGHGCGHNHSHENITAENEKKTLIVIIFTLITMAAEIFFGYVTGSIALLSDGWHMGTHAFALTIAFAAYIFMRKIKDKEHSDAVCEKISALAGYTSSILLICTAFWIMYESVDRFINPLEISFNEAILVAFIGLIVNFVCLLIMENKHSEHVDYNYKSAYIHILTDAMTSVFAIFALFSGKYFGWYILDPITGFIASILILKWGFGLIKNTAGILIDSKLLSH